MAYKRRLCSWMSERRVFEGVPPVLSAELVAQRAPAIAALLSLVENLHLVLRETMIEQSCRPTRQM